MSQSLNLHGKRLLLFVAFCFLLIVIGALIGVGIRSAIGCNSKKKSPAPKKSMQERTKEAFQQHSKILDEMKAENIKNNLEYLTRNPHIAGSKESKDQGLYVANKLRQYGFDKVKIHPYNILLSYPEKPGQVTFKTQNGSVIHNFTVIEPTLTPDENISKIVYPFNAYSPAKTAEAELVYANYGRTSDFTALKNAGISVKGKIVIMRYGPTSRGAKVENAHSRGAVGVLLFSDPENYNPLGKDNRYPKGWGLPETGIQRGTIIRRQGDALSRDYPSKDGFYRIDVSKATPLPQIPSQPIQFKDAEILLRQMDGISGSSSFQGDGGFTYRMNSSKLVRMTVNTKLESRMTYVVSGMIHGKIEPDRLVLLGNHRDAWVYGAGDASSGQAVMLEIGRSLGVLRKKGWRPRRSIMLCSWDAEEYGIHGSTEWVEEHGSMLQERAVAYLNVDIAVEGNYTVRLRGVPELDNAFFEATKRVPAPDTKTSLFDDWIKKDRNPDVPTEPKTTVLSSGSDYKPFYQTLGISCVDLRYMFAKLKGTKYPYMYPMYHSLHDTFRWMTAFVDPDYRYHLTTGKMWASLALNLADSLILPFNLSRAAAKVEYYAKKFDTDHKKYLSGQNISTDLLVEAAGNLTKSVGNFEQKLKNINLENSLQVRMANDRIQNFQKQFVHQSGTMGRNDLRNVVYATRSNLMVSGNKFTAVGQAIARAYKGTDKDWDKVKRELMIAVYHIQSAAQSYENIQ